MNSWPSFDTELSRNGSEKMLKRLRDWWTRPSWEEFLAEHQTCVDLGDRAVQLICERGDLADRLAFNARANSDMCMKLCDAKLELKGSNEVSARLAADLLKANDELAWFRSGDLSSEHKRGLAAIQEVLGNGADEQAWPPGTHYADALGPYVDSLHAEIARIRKLGIESCENVPVHSINIEGGAVEVNTLPPHWAMRAMGASFLESLDGAPNWRAIEIGPIPSDGGYLLVTVCRKSGDSPVETVGKLKACIEELLSLDGGSVYHPPGGPAQDIFGRAHALLNPEKKD